MAKKVRKDGERKEERKVVFEAPEFDEREYLTEQLHNIRTTLFFIILAIPMGAAWAFTSISTGFNVAGLAVSVVGYIVGTQFLKLVLGIDLLEGPKRLLGTTFLLYLFTSLAFAVVLSNPPANDVTEPSITDVVVAVKGLDDDDGKWRVLMRHRATMPRDDSNITKMMRDNPDQRLFYVKVDTFAEQGDNISILVRAGDASGLHNVVIVPEAQGIPSTPYTMKKVTETRWNQLNLGGDYYLWGEHYYEYVIEDAPAGSIYFTITVEDNVGLTSEFETESSGESILVV